jgi:deoxyguanosine kinase
MLISIEGCVGIGKTTLVEQCTRLFHCTPVYEQPERNPFLADFYQAHDKRAWAKPLLSTFLFLQERQLRQALPFAEQGHLVLCDFHPLKNLVFARALLETSEQARLADLYQGLCIPQPDLVIYLKADEPTILSRIRKKPDPFEPSLDLTFITQITWAYDTFFRSVYKGRALAVDTSRWIIMSGRRICMCHSKRCRRRWICCPICKQDQPARSKDGCRARLLAGLLPRSERRLRITETSGRLLPDERKSRHP